MLTPDDVEQHFEDLLFETDDTDPFRETARFIQTFADHAALAPCLIHLKQLRLRAEEEGHRATD